MSHTPMFGYAQVIANAFRNKNDVKILDIKSKKVKNILRGLDSESFHKVKVALKKIKNEGDRSDYKKALIYIRSNPLFENIPIGKIFNSTCSKEISDLVVYPTSEIVAYVDNHSTELIELSEIATRILKCLENNELLDAINYCNEMVDSKGVSIFLLRLISFINNRFHLLGKESGSGINELDALKKRIVMSNAGLVDEAIQQLSNLRTSHLAVCKRINDLDNDSPHKVIARHFIHPIPRERKEFECVLSALFSFSLFDAFLYLQRIKLLKLPYVSDFEACNSLSDAYMEISSVDFQPTTIYEKMDQDTAYYYLRECFLFVEQIKALNFLVVHGHYYANFNLDLLPNQYIDSKIRNYFCGLRSLAQLKQTEMSKTAINWEVYDPKTCGMLENSSALIHLLHKKQGVLSLEEREVFVKLMTFTRDIGDTCKPEYLETIAYESDCKELQLVVRCLITINKKSQYTEHELRSTIQEYCIESFDGDLIELFKHVYGLSPAVTEHLILTCNEKFLSTLFHLMDKPVDALESRANMLQWYGQHTGEEHFEERAKTLRIDIQVQKEKGTIDDSRIYVDPLKYTQWFEDKMVNEMTVALDSISNADVLVASLDFGIKNHGVSPIDIVTRLLMSCYNEFCNNKSFGIASYLGRRIRHGTFDGTATSELQLLAEKDEYKHLFKNAEFNKQFWSWFEQYDVMIEDLKKVYLHIKSKRKIKGSISTEIDSVYKRQVARQMFIQVVNDYSKHRGVMTLPSLIIDYCWRLAEYDLIETKKLLSERKSSHGIFKYKPSKGNIKFKKEISKFTQEVNAITNQKFGLMASWFNKPSYASPSTDIYLLFQAVVSEVKDNVGHFSPKIDLGGKKFTVNGGTYYVIYDALYVLIDNAAKHGKSDGRIHFSVTIPEGRSAIRLNLSAELDNLDKLHYATSRIEKELASADENAHVVEGNSGMKKLKRLEHEGSISEVRFNEDEANISVNFEFYFELNSRGKYDDIDS